LCCDGEEALWSPPDLHATRPHELSSTAEAQAVSDAIGADCRQLWLSFTLDDTVDVGVVVSGECVPLLRSGERVEAAVAMAMKLHTDVFLFDCSQPEIVGTAMHYARLALDAGKSDIALGALGKQANTIVTDHQPIAASQGFGSC